MFKISLGLALVLLLSAGSVFPAAAQSGEDLSVAHGTVSKEKPADVQAQEDKLKPQVTVQFDDEPLPGTASQPPTTGPAGSPMVGQGGGGAGVATGSVTSTASGVMVTSTTGAATGIASGTATDAATGAAIDAATTPETTTPQAGAPQVQAATQTQAPSDDSLSQVEDWIRDNLDPAAEGQAAQGGAASTQCAQEQASACAILAQTLGAPHTAFRQDLAALSFDDWTVYGTGQAALPAASLNPQRDKALGQRMASVQARKAMLDLLLALPLDGSRTVGQALQGQAKVLAELRGLVQNSRLENQCVAPGAVGRDMGSGAMGTESVTGGSMGMGGTGVAFMADGACTALARMNFLGALAEKLTPMAEPFYSKLPPRVDLDPALVAGLARGEQVDQAYRQSLAELGGFTGVVIDARGLDAKPALLPRVVDLNGQAAYGAFQVSRKAATERGMAVYAASPEDPRVVQRVGARPLVVRALAVSGENGCDLLVRPSDGDLIRKVFESRELSEAGSLAIVR